MSGRDKCRKPGGIPDVRARGVWALSDSKQLAVPGPHGAPEADGGEEVGVVGDFIGDDGRRR